MSYGESSIADTLCNKSEILHTKYCILEVNCGAGAFSTGI
jgi:hypothetical protein